MLTPRDQRLFREGSYLVELDDRDQMVAELLLEVVADAGSVEVAARAIGLDVPDLKARVAWARTPDPDVRESYVVGVEQWDRMLAGLLLAIVTDVGSARAAAKVVGVPRSTFATWCGARRSCGDKLAKRCPSVLAAVPCIDKIQLRRSGIQPCIVAISC